MSFLIFSRIHRKQQLLSIRVVDFRKIDLIPSMKTDKAMLKRKLTS